MPPEQETGSASATGSPLGIREGGDRRRSVVHVSTFPPEHCGIARHLALWVFETPSDRSVVVLGNRVATAPSDTIEVRRVWRKGDPLYPLRLARAVRGVARDARPTVLVQHQFFLYGGGVTLLGFVPLLVLLRLGGSRVAVQLHGVVTPDHLEPEAREVGLRAPPAFAARGLTWFYRAVARWSGLLIVQTDAMKEALVRRYGIAPDKVEVVPLAWGPLPGVDHDGAKQRLGFGGRFLFVFHGFLDPTKGLEALLRAFAQACAERPELSLALVGEVSPTLPRTLRGYAVSLDELARELGVADRVTLTGYVSPERLTEYLAAADAIVLPYTGRSVLSGSSVLGVVGPYGRPLVVSETSRFTSELTPGETALFVAPGDAVELARAMLRAVDDPNLLRRLGEGVRALAAQRSPRSIAGQMDRVLSRLEVAAR